MGRRRLPDEEAAPLRAAIEVATAARDAVQRILDDAVRQGLLLGLTYEEVGALIGMTKPTVFNHYGTLDQLKRGT